jgi:NAD(P)-dependent dehydrogenase (short-subunit alcohol dehydrogenase family)
MSTSKVALITGANKGLGLEIARQLGKQGITVVIGARDESRGTEAANTLKSEGIDARFLKLDVTQEPDITAAVGYFEKEFGKLDILVNNAGINVDHSDWTESTAASISQADLRKTFDANVFGVVALTQALLPLLKKSEAGRIVNHSSILGSLTLHADPSSPIYSTKLFGYNASKTALNAFTVHLAHALRDTAIKVNSAHPGWVKTDMGTDAAPMEIPEGAKTAVELATLPAGGPTGGFYHLGETLPW